MRGPPCGGCDSRWASRVRSYRSGPLDPPYNRVYREPSNFSCVGWVEQSSALAEDMRGPPCGGCDSRWASRVRSYRSGPLDPPYNRVYREPSNFSCVGWVEQSSALAEDMRGPPCGGCDSRWASRVRSYRSGPLDPPYNRVYREPSNFSCVGWVEQSSALAEDMRGPPCGGCDSRWASRVRSYRSGPLDPPYNRVYREPSNFSCVGWVEQSSALAEDMRGPPCGGCDSRWASRVRSYRSGPLDPPYNRVYREPSNFSCVGWVEQSSALAEDMRGPPCGGCDSRWASRV